MNKVWQATEARANFATLLDAAEKAPQVVRRSGEEFVVLRRREYEASKPTLKDFLLNGGLRPSGPVSDADVDEMFGRTTGAVMAPRDVDLGD